MENLRDFKNFMRSVPCVRYDVQAIIPDDDRLYKLTYDEFAQQYRSMKVFHTLNNYNPEIKYFIPGVFGNVIDPIDWRELLKYRCEESSGKYHGLSCDCLLIRTDQKLNYCDRRVSTSFFIYTIII